MRPHVTACDRISDIIPESDFGLILLHFSPLPDRIDRMTASFACSPLKKCICRILRQPLDPRFATEEHHGAIPLPGCPIRRTITIFSPENHEESHLHPQIAQILADKASFSPLRHKGTKKNSKINKYLNRKD